MYAIILSTKDDDWKCIDKKCHGHCELESDFPIRLSRRNVFKISKIPKRAKSQKTFYSSSPDYMLSRSARAAGFDKIVEN